MAPIQDSTFWRIVCFFTRTDLDVLAESNRFDKLTVIWTFIAVLLAFVLHTVMWATAASMFVAGTLAAIIAGVGIALVICTMEIAMAASDWSLKGVLATGGVNRFEAVKIFARIGIAVLFSFATAWAFSLWLHGPELTHRTEVERKAANAPLVEEARLEKARVHAEIVQPAQRALADKEAARAAARARAEQARAEVSSASTRADSAAVDAGREENGLGRAAGRGPRYADALVREQQARTGAAAALQAMQQDAREADRLDREAAEARADLMRSVQAYEKRTAQIEAHIRRDERYVESRDSLLTRKAALDKLYRDPVVGEGANRLEWVVRLTLICFELVLLLVKVLFAPASVYQVRLIARTRIEAEQIDHDTGQRLAQLHRAPANLRIVARDDRPAAPPETPR